MKVTILITSYNYSKYLRRCIRSCLNQSFSKSEYEILIVDDASTDGSQNILREVEKDYANIRVVYNDVNLGLGASCRVGAAKALGHAIVRVDADDYVNEHFVTVLYSYLSMNNASAVACDYVEVDSYENILNRKSAKKEPIACGVMFKTDILHEIGSYKSLRIHEEKELLERFSRSHKMEHLNIPLYRYFIHEDSLSRKSNEEV